MIIECKNYEELNNIKIIIKDTYNKDIFNFNVNEVKDRIFLIIDGNISKISKDFLKANQINCVFSSLEEDLYFIKNKDFNKEIKIGNRLYNKNDNLVSIIAGPCEIEDFDSLYQTAYNLKKCGVSIFRAMCEKPRTSPYNFQGIGEIGFSYLNKIKKELNIPVLTEVFCEKDIQHAKKYEIDIIQIGSRNMQNYNLIKLAAKSGITTVLKKGMWCNNIQLLKAAEYFFVYGNGNVILCERGIQTHETTTRNTFDISSIEYLKKETYLPIMADSSHGTGNKDFIIPTNQASILVGADLIEVEVHIKPEQTIKPGDYYQMLNIEEYKEMLKRINEINLIIGKKFDFKYEK